MSLIQFKYNGVVAGCDEAGRGCLAGPVVAASVVLPENCIIEGLNDSKQLTEKKREALFPIVKEKAIAYGIGVYSNAEIDEVNILKASFFAMHRAIKAMKNVQPDLLLIDGNRFIPFEGVKHECIIKGDGKYLSIAAASILAKVTRDHLMEELSNEYPHYKWSKNKGYPTKEHRQAIIDFGATPYHRLSFKLIPEEQLTLFK